MPIAVWDVGGFWKMEVDTIRATIPALKEWRRNVDADSSTSVTIHQRRFNTVNEVIKTFTNNMTVIPCCGDITCYSARSSLRATLFYSLVPHTYYYRCIMPCRSRNFTIWQTCFTKTQSKLTHVLMILRSSTSMKHNCISCHVSTEQSITLTCYANEAYLH